MKPYQQSEQQIGAMPQTDRRDRIVVIASVLVALFAVCISIADTGDTPAPVQIASSK